MARTTMGAARGLCRLLGIHPALPGGDGDAFRLAAGVYDRYNPMLDSIRASADSTDVLAVAQA